MKPKLFSALFMIIAITACDIPRIAPNAVKLQIEYNWTHFDYCSSVSPEILVQGIPQPTKLLKVTLTDIEYIL